MESDKQITQYLDEFAQILVHLGVQEPFHILIAGGAYMLLQKKRRSTQDIDFALVQVSEPHPQPNQVLSLVIQRAEVSRNTVAYSTEFKEAVKIVARRYNNLPDDWINDEAAVYYYDDAPQAEAIFWRSFREMLYVYLPTMEYILATKIAAYRPKDANDIQTLLHDLHIHTRAQAKAIVDTFLLPDAQEFWEVEEKLDFLFP